LKKLLMMTAACVAVAGAAHASIIPVLTSVTAEGDLFRFSYQGTLAGDAGVTDGSRLVIFDFAGFAGGLEAPSPFITATTELTTVFYPGLDGVLPSPPHDDDPLIPNLVFVWNGPDFHTSGGPFTDINFDGLSALSTFSGIRPDGFSAITIKNNGPNVGTMLYNVGTTSVPVGAVTPTAAVPEPASWAMMIIGFGGMGALARRRQILATR
jgi:hypothetical protein